MGESLLQCAKRLCPHFLTSELELPGCIIEHSVGRALVSFVEKFLYPRTKPWEGCLCDLSVCTSAFVIKESRMYYMNYIIL